MRRRDFQVWIDEAHEMYWGTLKDLAFDGRACVDVRQTEVRRVDPRDALLIYPSPEVAFYAGRQMGKPLMPFRQMLDAIERRAINAMGPIVVPAFGGGMLLSQSLVLRGVRGAKT